MKLYQVIRGEKLCYGKAVGYFKDKNKNNVCITELLAHGLDPDGHDPKYAHIALVNETKGLIVNDRHIGPELVHAINNNDKDDFINAVKEMYYQTGSIDVNHLIWLNDKTNMSFDDFERFFEELDI